MMQRRWVHPEKSRYYQVDFVQDLLGDWTLVLSWGGLGSRRGGMRILAVTSEAAGEDLVEAIAKRRRQRGYVELSGRAGEEADLIQRTRVRTPRLRAGHDGGSEDLFEASDKDRQQEKSKKV
ncbi:WGR domain-containing protein [Thiocystis violacea]|uniref:WGR domain-containing protein n=1 Tax=Thiocystis violacea TaxID=13725 RepID=UPI0031F74659